VQIRLDDQYNIKHVNGSKSETVVTYENYNQYSQLLRSNTYINEQYIQNMKVNSKK